jgi:hypothetical protein
MATAVLVLTIPIILAFLFFGNGSGDASSLRALYLLSVVVYLVLYCFTWTRGRAVLLAFALLFFSAWVLFEVQGDSSGVVPFQSVIQGQTNASLNVLPSSSGGSSGTDTETVALILGIAYLGIGAILDRRKLAGPATPFIALGAFYTVFGAIALAVGESTTVIGLVAAAAGALVGIVGGLGKDRRGSTWIGVITVVGGLLAVIADIAGDDTLGIAGLCALAALILGGLAFVLAPVLGEAADGARVDDR